MNPSGEKRESRVVSGYQSGSQDLKLVERAQEGGIRHGETARVRVVGIATKGPDESDRVVAYFCGARIERLETLVHGEGQMPARTPVDVRNLGFVPTEGTFDREAILTSNGKLTVDFNIEAALAGQLARPSFMRRIANRVGDLIGAGA